LALGVVVGVGDLVHLLTRDPEVTLGAGLLALLQPCFRIVRTLLVTFANEQFVLPGCFAMGFAYVLRETRCDQHLVQLLVKPLRFARGLFVPGVIVVGFVVNIPIISQASSLVVVGTVLIPLARAVRLPPAVLGAALVLGSSLGGELLNPGAPELRSTLEALRETRPSVTTADCVTKIRPLLALHLLTSTVVFWMLNRWAATEAEPAPPPAAFRVNLAKAAVPFIPLLILLLLAPPFQVWRVPPDWLLVNPSSKAEGRAFDSRLIGAAMLLGVVAAALTTPRTVQSIGRAFFDGTGYAFTQIVALIVCANCFGEGIKLIGLDTLLAGLIQAQPGLLLPLASGIPLLFALVCGSGFAATQSLVKLFVEPSTTVGVDPLQTGAIVSIGSAAGRTMSPVSAVTLMGAKLTDVSPFALVRRVIIPLVVGLVATVLLAMLVS
jgi:DcuC family C4-dicarboxylate transporter